VNNFSRMSQAEPFARQHAAHLTCLTACHCRSVSEQAISLLAAKRENALVDECVTGLCRLRRYRLCVVAAWVVAQQLTDWRLCEGSLRISGDLKNVAPRLLHNVTAAPA